MKTNGTSLPYQIDLLYILTKSNFKLQYQNTFLGLIWAIIDPVAQITVLGFVFKFISQTPINHYFSYLLTGTIPWIFFSRTISQSTHTFLNNRQLFSKPFLPPNFLTLSNLNIKLINLIISLFLLFIFIIISPFNLQLHPLFFFLALLWLFTITYYLSLLISTLTVQFRDLIYIIKGTIPLWFYATPIIYSAGQIPQKFQFILFLNPLSGIINLIHYSLSFTQLLPIPVYACNLALTLLILFTSHFVHKKFKPFLVDYL